MRKNGPLLKLSAILSLLAALGGCSVNQAVNTRLADALSSSQGTLFTADEDPQLVADALPFTLKAYEALLEKNPSHRGLLGATAKGFILYGYAFVYLPAEPLFSNQPWDEAQKSRARKLLLRGRDYMLQSLELKYPGFNEALMNGSTDSLLATTSPADTEALFWSGMSWTLALTCGPRGLGTLLALPRALSLVKKAESYNPGFNQGAIQEFLMGFYASVPPALGGSSERASAYYQEALRFGGGQKAAPLVQYALKAELAAGRCEQSRALLNEALDIDVAASSSQRLFNTLYQQRARLALQQLDAHCKVTE
jgi:predicted anti-sigma-YlaC factor YlaD